MIHVVPADFRVLFGGEVWDICKIVPVDPAKSIYRDGKFRMSLFLRDADGEIVNAASGIWNFEVDPVPAPQDTKPVAPDEPVKEP